MILSVKFGPDILERLGNFKDGFIFNMAPIWSGELKPLCILQAMVVLNGAA